jgi:serine/threonine protein kinase
MSPEVVKHYHYTKKSDIWGVGCVMIEMLTGKHPWPDYAQMQALFKVLRISYQALDINIFYSPDWVL